MSHVGTQDSYTPPAEPDYESAEREAAAYVGQSCASMLVDAIESLHAVLEEEKGAYCLALSAEDATGLESPIADHVHELLRTAFIYLDAGLRALPRDLAKRAGAIAQIAQACKKLKPYCTQGREKAGLAKIELKLDSASRRLEEKQREAIS